MKGECFVGSVGYSAAAGAGGLFSYYHFGDIGGKSLAERVLQVLSGSVGYAVNEFCRIFGQAAVFMSDGVYAADRNGREVQSVV